MLDKLKNIPDFSSLFDEEVFFVGGVVRDALLGKETHKDIDLISRLKPEEFIHSCKKRGIKTFETGLIHGTVSFRYEGVIYEHTTFRKDVSCDGRNATVKFSNSLKEDLSRRDFTINALAYHNEKIYDYFGGIDDLKAKNCVL